MTQQNFYLAALVTVSMTIPGIRSIMQRDYYVGAFLLAIPSIGWLTLGLSYLGYLSP